MHKRAIFTLARDFDAVTDTDNLAVAEIIAKPLALAFVDVVLEVRHCGLF
jgi:hypothetical protein